MNRSRMFIMMDMFILITIISCREFIPVHLNDCRRFAGMPGPEDMDIETTGPDQGRIIVSSQERRQFDPNGEMSEQGAVFFLTVGRMGISEPVMFEIKERDEMPFHPHGISLLKSGNDTYLFVVNHLAHKNNCIEIFQIRDRSLLFKSRLRSNLLFSPNDIVAVSLREFYVTNDRARSGFLGFIEILFSANWSNAVHYREGQWEIAVGDIAYANGIALSKDGSRLYISGVLDKGVHSYTRNPQDGRIGPEVSFYDLDSGADNIMWEDENNMIVAAHPDSIAFLKHVQDAESHSPSELYRIDVRNGQILRLFADDGTLIDAASTGLVFSHRLFISQVFDPEIVSCALE